MSVFHKSKVNFVAWEKEMLCKPKMANPCKERHMEKFSASWNYFCLNRFLSKQCIY